MSRRHRAEKREVLPDPKFGDIVLTKFMNAIMLDGKKSVAERIVYGALDIVEEKAKSEPMRMFHDALEHIKPSVEVRSRRVGGGMQSDRRGADSCGVRRCAGPGVAVTG